MLGTAACFGVIEKGDVLKIMPYAKSLESLEVFNPNFSYVTWPKIKIPGTRYIDAIKLIVGHVELNDGYRAKVVKNVHHTDPMMVEAYRKENMGTLVQDIKTKKEYFLLNRLD